MQEIMLFASHHWPLIFVLGLALVLLIVIENMKMRRSGTQLSPSKMTQLINHENAAVVDIRPTDAYVAGHIIDSISIPNAELSTKIKKLEKFKSRPIVIVCMTGSESQQAAGLLKNNGMNVFTLAGGIKAWREAEMPLVKE